jgi:SAM-dependent methyltransferase
MESGRPILSVSTDTYDPRFFARLAAVEDEHFWFLGRNRVLSEVTRSAVAGLAPGYRVLEVGCGTGNTLRALAQTCTAGRVFGMDLFAEGLVFARSRTSAALVQGDIRRPPFNSAFDMIGLFDVLEHLPDDTGVLRYLRSMMVPGGKLLLTVPAYPALWSGFDEAAAHQRRYISSDLRQKLQDTGYRVEYLTYYMAGILPAVWLARKAQSLWHRRGPRDRDTLQQQAEAQLRVGPLNSFFALLLKPECWIVSHRMRIPFGTSLLAVASRA